MKSIFGLLVVATSMSTVGCIADGGILSSAFQVNQALALIQTVLDLIPAV